MHIVLNARLSLHARHAADHVRPGSIVGQHNQFTRRNGCGQAHNRALRENNYRPRVFMNWGEFSGALGSRRVSRGVHSNWNFSASGAASLRFSFCRVAADPCFGKGVLRSSRHIEVLTAPPRGRLTKFSENTSILRLHPNYRNSTSVLHAPNGAIDRRFRGACDAGVRALIPLLTKNNS